MKKKVGLYDPFLDTLGGGELHVLSILQVLDSLGYEVSIFWDTDLAKQIQKKFSLRFLNGIKFMPNVFKAKVSILEKLKTLSGFSLFIYVTDGSYFFSSAKHNYVFCMVPDKNLYSMTPLNRLKTHNYSFITNSVFTHKWLESWEIPNAYLYPYVNDQLIKSHQQKKENIILSVGRFFSHLHTKQHEKTIEMFNALQKKDKRFLSYSLVLTGGLKAEDRPYFISIKKLAQKNPSIILKPDISYPDLMNYYEKARFYWHLTGYGIDEKNHPEKVEHLGITPLEAMAGGCITFCYQAGGPKEFISNGQNGFLFTNASELLQLTSSIQDDETKQKKIVNNAKKTVKKYFSYQVFEEQVKKTIV